MSTEPVSLGLRGPPSATAVFTRVRRVAFMWLLVFAGCDDVKKTAEGEQKIAAEQAVIRAYADSVPEVDRKLTAFLEAWGRANERRATKDLKDDISANVKPAVVAHVEALAAMPTGSAELTAIHAPLVAAYREAAAAFDRFVAGVNEDNLDAEYAKLLEAMDKVKVAENAYFTALEAYYTAHRMTLKTAP